MNPEISPALLRKYLAGTCTPAEQQLIDQWYASFASEPDLIPFLPAVEQTRLRQRLLRQIKNKIHQPASQPAEVQQDTSQPAATPQTTKGFAQLPAWPARFGYYALRVAAVLVLVSGFTWLAFRSYQVPPPAAARLSPVMFHNPSARVKPVRLPDGSKVWLQQNSRLVLAPDFNKTRRPVTLSGEAFFEVTPDKARPFEIWSQQVRTRVVGTSFNIKAYAQAATVEIAVVTGQVFVFSPARQPGAGSQVVLRPHQQATYLKAGQRLVKKRVVGPRMVWARTSLSFRDTPVRQVVQQLSAHFATRITLANAALNNCTIQGEFTNQNLPEILEVVCQMIEADYQFYKEAVVITGQGCAPPQSSP